MFVMKHSNRFPMFAVCAMGAVGALWTVTTRAQEIPTEGPVPTSATVRVESKSHAPLDPAMLKLEVNGHQTPIESITPIRAGQAQVAMLIDDGLRSNFGLQERDLKLYDRSRGCAERSAHSRRHPGRQRQPVLRAFGVCEAVAVAGAWAPVRTDDHQRR